MLKNRMMWAALVVAFLLLIGAVGCGGGGTDQDPVYDPAAPPKIELPDVPAATDKPVAVTIEGLQTDAPLGTDPAYNVTPVTGIETSRVAAKAGSTLGPTEMFKLLDATISLADTQAANVNWDATDLSYQEGTRISLWLKYEIAANITYNRTWTITATGLNYSDASINSGSGGVVTTKFDYTLPYLAGTADQNAVYKCIVNLPKVGSIVIIVDPGESYDEIPFKITKVPVDPYNYSDGDAQMGWEDLISDSDYDYNDLVTRMRVKEYRRKNDHKLVQIDLYVKAIARGAGYDHAWQFNMDGAFPGATAVAYVQNYYANGTAHGGQKVWRSTDGVSIPIFETSKYSAIPPPPESYATNTVSNTSFVDGDYATATILFDTPLAQGTYTPMPYKPQLRVRASSNPTGGSVYIIGLWTRRGDPVDSNKRPLAFVIPFSYRWPAEGRKIWYAYPAFSDWVKWVNDMTKPDSAQPSFWDDTPVEKSSGTWNVVTRTGFFKATPAPPLWFTNPQ